MVKMSFIVNDLTVETYSQISIKMKSLLIHMICCEAGKATGSRALLMPR